MRTTAPLPGKRRRGCFGTIMKNWFIKHREVLAYLVFGVLTTLLNIVLYALFSRLFGYEAANSWGNVLDNVICILFAYVTNRAFVFASRTQGREALKEFGAFVTCRLGTLVLDAAIMMIFGNLLAAQGAALVESFMNGALSLLAGWFGPDTVLQMATGGAAPAPSISDGSAAIAIIGGADGPTAIFVTSFYDAQALWGMAVKVFSNVVVVVLNYVFSKLIVFKKK
jgi:putative flippase GtrA